MNVRIFALATLVTLAFHSIAIAGDTKPVKRTVKTHDGLTIVYEDRGKGDTALIFLHGWCGDREYWKHQAGAFADTYRVITVDQAGHGESGKERNPWTVKSLARDVETIAKTLSLDRVILVGHSMGGPVSLVASKMMPGRVVAVIGVDTLQNAEFKMPEETTKMFLAAFEKDFKGTMRGALDGMLGEKTDADLKKWLITRAEVQDPKMAVALIRNMTGLDHKVLLKEAKAPVRCINSGGGYKFYTPTDVKINKKYADYDAVTMSDIGHYPMLERPDEFNQKLRGVLKEFGGKR